MRGRHSDQPAMFYAIDMEELIPTDHPLRPIKRRVDTALAEMQDQFEAAYSADGRASVPPERLLKATLLQCLFSIRSERQLVDRIRTDLLFRWFLDMDPAEDVFHPTTFTHNRDRLAEHGLTAAFFSGVVKQAMDAGLTSDDHFSVDGTLIESHASLKSLKRVDDDESDQDDEGEGGSRNPSVNYRGERRTNDTHYSPTDPEARLYRKGQGQPARLYHSGHAIAENRNGLLLAIDVGEANGTAEREAALSMLDELYDGHELVPKTLGADKGYDAGPFYTDLVGRVLQPHVAMREGRIKGHSEDAQRRRIQRRRTRNKGFRLSQRKRKLVEEAFGWMKTIAGLRRTKLVGRWKLSLQMQMAAAAYNLVRMNKLAM